MLNVVHEHGNAAEMSRLRAQIGAIEDIAQLGCWEWDVQTQRVTWSAGLYSIYALDPAVHVPSFESYLARVHPHDREHVQAALARAIESGTGFEFRERILRPDGTERLLRSSGRVLRAQDGSALRLAGVCYDITAQQFAEMDALRLVEERAARTAAEEGARRQQFLARASAVLASSLDYEATLRNVAQLAVPEIADWCAVDLLDDAGALRRLAVEHRDPTRVQLAHELSRRYPPPRDESIGVWNVIATGQPYHLPEIPESMLEQAAVDAEHLAMIRNLGLHSCVLVPLKTGERTLGVLTFVQAESKRLLGADDVPMLQDLGVRGATAISNAHTMSALQDAHTRLEEQAVEMEAQASELEMQTEELQTAMAELESRNEELRELTLHAQTARSEAEAANEAKSQFLATMSHELRTPLNAIAGYAELMQIGIHGPVTEQQVESITRIQRNQRRLLSLINDILNFAKIDAGHMRVDLRDVPVGELIAELDDTVGRQVRDRGQTLSIADAPAGLHALTDRERAEQVLLNLLSNASKFTPSGGSISVTCDGGDGVVRIAITDTGRGIPLDQIDSIFDPFVQIDTQFTRSTEGVGLGLAISRELARAMGGDITVNSTPGAGSTFLFTLPAAPASARP